MKGPLLMGHLEGLTLPLHKIHDVILYTCLRCEVVHSGPVEKASFQKGVWVYAIRCKEAPGIVQLHPESVVSAAEKTLFEVMVGNGVFVRVRQSLEEGTRVFRLVVGESHDAAALFEGDPDSCILHAKHLVESFRKAAQAPFMSAT